MSVGPYRRVPFRLSGRTIEVQTWALRYPATAGACRIMRLQSVRYMYWCAVPRDCGWLQDNGWPLPESPWL